MFVTKQAHNRRYSTRAKPWARDRLAESNFKAQNLNPNPTNWIQIQNSIIFCLQCMWRNFCQEFLISDTWDSATKAPCRSMFMIDATRHDEDNPRVIEKLCLKILEWTSWGWAVPSSEQLKLATTSSKLRYLMTRSAYSANCGWSCKLAWAVTNNLLALGWNSSC